MRFCTVLSVDPDTATCSVDHEGLRIDGVTLRAVDDGSRDGIYAIPKVGSPVLVADVRGDFSTMAVVASSEVDTVRIAMGETTAVVDSGGVVVDGGNLGGMVKVRDLVDKINRLESLVNNMLSILRGTVIPLAPSGTYPFAPGVPATRWDPPTSTWIRTSTPTPPPTAAASTRRSAPSGCAAASSSTTAACRR